ncbi:Transposase, type 1 [Cinara cedri]|uniref:Transposase, type 1 n=1 Tax=Cinara cedri TaxID=506608 RepID=A0A5E4MRP7_9HEMI|nr:Transposase, type 1 [Cinara cedri]
MTEWVPEGQTVNQIYYLSVLATLRERVRKKRPELWKNNSWILHQDNALAHNALSVKQYLAGKRTPVLEHAPYSPDLAPWRFTNDKNYAPTYSWILHQDNAPAHNALSVKQYLAGKRTPVLEHAPYSPDLAPCDFILFPKMKSALKGTRSESMEAVKQKTAELLKALTNEDFQHCFDQWKKRMEMCVARGGEYIEGEHLNVE